MELNNCRGDLIDVSARKAALVTACRARVCSESCAREHSRLPEGHQIGVRHQRRPRRRRRNASRPIVASPILRGSLLYPYS